MEKRLIVILILLGILGWAGLVMIQKQFEIGRFAVSPQQVVLRPKGGAIVGGGRGGLGLLAVGREDVDVKIRCAADERQLKLIQDTSSDEVCGLRIRWRGRTFERPGGQQFEVSWEE